MPKLNKSQKSKILEFSRDYAEIKKCLNGEKSEKLEQVEKIRQMAIPKKSEPIPKLAIPKKRPKETARPPVKKRKHTPEEIKRIEKRL